MIGIRREDKNRWERRAPLTPDHVAALARTHGIRFRVEPSALRVFPDREYADVGAEVSADLACCRTILGIKEIPPERLLGGTTYFFFAHVTKGQPHNMPMLRRILDLRSTLVDYERIVDDKGRRLVYFGLHAGHAGMIDALWALGKRLEREGTATGLEQVRLAHEYASLDEATAHLNRVGEGMRRNGIPPHLHPLLFVFTGSGNVTRGALEILDRFPTQEVFPEDLEGLARDPERPRNVLYHVRLSRSDRYARLDGAPFDPADLARTPGRFRSTTGSWLPHASVVVNGAFWEPRLPRLISNADLRALESTGARGRLRVIADIACDLAGGVEATVRTTDPGDPVYSFDPATGRTEPGFGGTGPLVLAVDNLPCELPAESSEHFGDALLRYLGAVDRCDWDLPFYELALPAEVRRAVVAHRGELAPDYLHLGKSLAVERA